MDHAIVDYVIRRGLDAQQVANGGKPLTNKEWREELKSDKIRLAREQIANLINGVEEWLTMNGYLVVHRDEQCPRCSKAMEYRNAKPHGTLQ